ncbi:MAG: hypothetical protein PUJ80_00745 [Verrucomicrobiota bacterium]|nr:hypothetical protein [Verrucomicrobiota bacterium]
MSDKWYLRTQDDTFGPETKDRLIEWARMGRIQPGQDVSEDGENWRPAVEVPFLDMRWSIDIGDGTPRGPFNKHAADALLKSGRLPPGAKLIEVVPAFEEGGRGNVATEEVGSLDGEEAAVAEAAEAPAATEDPPSARLPETDSDLGDNNVRIVEKIVKVPVEVVKEVVREVPVEKVVEKERIVHVESPELLARAAALETELSAVREEAVAFRRKAEEVAAEVAATREEAAVFRKRAEEGEAKAAAAKQETLTLEGEIRRLPSNAKEAADTEAAVYWLLRGEADDLMNVLESEKAEAEAAQKRWRERSERLAARRVEILKLIGGDVQDMKNRALRANPADPRTVQLRQELDALRLVAEKSAYESGQRIKDLTRELNEKRTEADRLAAQVMDVKRLQEQIQRLREMLQDRERDLVAERQANEELRRNAESAQQALLKRLSELEGGLRGNGGLGHSQDPSHSSRFPIWMKLKK